MPRLGLGVFKAGAGDGTRLAVRHALNAGYRHVDTAAIYGNEAEVGDAIRRWCDDTGHARDEIFVTTKLWRDHHGYDAALRAFDASQRALNLGPVDLYLIHWPVPEHRLETWRALEHIFSQGRCRAIGVSNFMIHHLEPLLADAHIIPHVNQVEIHPFLPQHTLVTWCRDHGIQIAAYSPLTKGRLLNDPQLLAMAAQLERSPAQVLLRWGLEQGHAILPKSSHPTRIAENAQLFDFSLEPDLHTHIQSLARNTRTAWDPTSVP